LTGSLLKADNRHVPGDILPALPARETWIEVPTWYMSLPLYLALAFLVAGLVMLVVKAVGKNKATAGPAQQAPSAAS
jgi:hypothetical protein